MQPQLCRVELGRSYVRVLAKLFESLTVCGRIITVHHSHEHISTSTSAARAVTAGLLCLPAAAPRETERIVAT